MTVQTAQTDLNQNFFFILISVTFLCGIKSDTDLLQCVRSVNGYIRIHVTLI